ncbi:MAG TPA: type IV secretion system DNA-binding domain-containing protein, partial [Anaeromyxobacteraceae bacterium]|nr:type IV secretion system DNA-binding domain-containing protein [Anaeromyxobacteraceae bacterium]
MHPDERRKLAAAIIVFLPMATWLFAVSKTETLARPKLLSFFRVAAQTPDKPILIAAAAGGLAAAILLVYVLVKYEAGGTRFRTFLRGTRVVRASALARKTRERANQVSVAGIPMPTKIETLHLLVGGSTGSGKSVLVRQLAFSALLRRDRVIVADPNGDMLSKFFRPGDVVLNPYDARGEGWSFFNEVRADFDFKRLALSIVPRGQSKEEEQWRQYARLLLSETAQKLAKDPNPTIRELFRLVALVPPEKLKDFLEHTAAESLFVGADKALASARFVLSTQLPEHLTMPEGDFSLRAWLADPNGGNLFITWREDMAEALRPLISAWVDVLCTSILSLDPDRADRRPIWMFLDELASLEKLASLQDAATKGRKAGLRIVAGLQSTAQLDNIYGRDAAQTLRSCFRSLVVLGGAKTDPKTCEDMSQSLGDHEVERETHSRSYGFRGNTTSSQIHRARERVVLPSEIASLPDLTG